MSSRREYEMLFQLSAQMGGGFNSTFSKAQQQLAALQKELQALNRSQSDIAAYQKQQKSVEATTQKLAVLQQQYDNIQKEIQKTGTYSSELENKLLSKQQQIDKTSAALARQTESLDKMGNELKEAGIDTNNLQGESARLAEEINKVKEAQDAAAEGANSFGEQSVAAFGAIQSAIATAGIAEALKEIVEAYMECVQASGNFEAAMSNVEALSGATGDEMAALTATAKELGATTVFTAQESAEAMGYMAMAGWDATEMINGMDGVLQLAAASGEDLAMVSDIVTDNLTAFGLKASDTAHFADVLAAAATNSNTSVSIMGETFKMSASIAGALGYSVEDVAVAVGLMANSGVKGSIAGTALKNTFNGLLEGVTLTSSAFGEYEYSAVKADGTMKDFSSTIDELRIYFDQMTEAERVNNAMTIAGARGYNGLLAILNATDEDYASLTASINSCTGAAQEMAAVKLDNLNGELTLMQSAYEGLVVTLGDQFNPEMRELYSLGADVFSVLDKFVQAHPGLTKGVMAFVGVLAAATAGLTAYAAITKVVIPLMKLFTASIPGVGVIMAVVGAVAALTGVVVGLANAADSEAKEVREMTETSREQYYQLQELNAEYQQACELYGETSDEARYLAWEIEELNASFENGKQSLADYVSECEMVNDELTEMLTANKEAFNEVNNSEANTMALVHKLQELASATEQTTATQEQMKAIIAELNEVVPNLGISFESVTSGATDYVSAIEAAVEAQAAMARYEAAQQGMVDAYNAQFNAQNQLADLENQRAAAQDRLTAAQEAYNAKLDMLSRYDTTGTSGIAMLFSQERKELLAAEDAMAAYDQQILETQGSLEQATSDYEMYLDSIVGYTVATEEASGTTADMAEKVQSVSERMAMLETIYEETYNAAHESVTGQYALWDEAAVVAATSADKINAAMEGQVTYWQDYNANLQSLTERSADIEGLSDVIASFADGR